MTDSERKRILIVSDDPETGALMRSILSGAGYSVGLLTFPGLTLEHIEIGQPDLVILDMLLLVLDEWPILEQMWHLSTPPPVIAISAPFSSPEALAMLSHHVRGHLTKPISANALLSTCRRLLQRQDAPQDTRPAERRSEPRRTFVGEVTFLTSKGRPLYSAQLLELSLSGARIEMGPLPETSFTPQQDVLLALRLPPSFQELHITARVEWCKDTLMGVRFINIEPRFQLWLERWIKRSPASPGGDPSQDKPNRPPTT
jgi:DNA-binding response OmpR family regulator